MAKTSDLDVAYVARLARVNLTEAEAKVFQKQLDDVLQYVEKLRQADITDVKPAGHALPIFNVFREDVTTPSLPQDDVLANAPESRDGFFIVPRIIEG